MKALIFDVFGTLVEVKKGNSAETILSHIISSGYEPDKQAFHSEWRTYYTQHTADGCDFMTEREIFISRIQMFYNRYDVNRNAQTDADELLTRALERKLYKDVLPALSQLRKKYRILLGSNTDNDVLDAVMKRNCLTADGVYTSETLRCYKPAPCFFRAILEANGLTTDDVLFIGDNPRDDIEGPRQLGIKTVLIDRNGKRGLFGQTYTISDLNELTKILSAET